MTEHLLHNAYIHPTIEKVRCAGMAEDVWCDMVGEACSRCVTRNDGPESLA